MIFGEARRSLKPRLGNSSAGLVNWVNEAYDTAKNLINLDNAG